MNNNKKIILKNEIVTDDKIKIDCSHTCFCNIVRIKYISINDTLEKHKELVRLAKVKGCKISYKNRYKKTLLELKEGYELEYKNYNDTFNTLKMLWQQKLKKGIFYGYGNDEEYQKISEVYCRIQKFNNIRNPINIVNSINNKINNYIMNLEYDDSCCKIFL